MKDEFAKEERAEQLLKELTGKSGWSVMKDANSVGISTELAMDNDMPMSAGHRKALYYIGLDTDKGTQILTLPGATVDDLIGLLSHLKKELGD